MREVKKAALSSPLHEELKTTGKRLRVFRTASRATSGINVVADARAPSFMAAAAKKRERARCLASSAAFAAGDSVMSRRTDSEGKS